MQRHKDNYIGEGCMSEYQYFEFQAIDVPLNQEQISELRSYSTRAQITPSSFVNEYNWGNFKGDPNRWIEQYFDAFLHLTNWGTRWFMLRIPKKLLNLSVTSTYFSENSMSCRTTGEHLILSFYADVEDYEWTDGEGWLSSLIPLRADILRGDYRCLYLGWLLGAEKGEHDDASVEPPVPPGLGNLNASLHALADFLCIDPDLMSSAAEKSAENTVSDLSREDIARWVADLAAKDKDDILTRLLGNDELHIGTELRQRAFRDIRGVEQQNVGQRSVGQLIAIAKEIGEERRKNEAKRRAQEKARREREQAEKRLKYLKSLNGKEIELWSTVDQLIATRQPKRYDEAISILQDLHDLADLERKKSEFSTRMNSLYKNHTKKVSLLEKFRKAKLIE